jgi:hypothetical protein
MRLEVHSEVSEEFLQAASFYDAQVPGLGLRVITEIDPKRKAFRCTLQNMDVPTGTIASFLDGQT